jgi:hypothetical protein
VPDREASEINLEAFVAAWAFAARRAFPAGSIASPIIVACVQPEKQKREAAWYEAMVAGQSARWMVRKHPERT